MVTNACRCKIQAPEPAAHEQSRHLCGTLYRARANHDRAAHIRRTASEAATLNPELSVGASRLSKTDRAFVSTRRPRASRQLSVRRLRDGISATNRLAAKRTRTDMAVSDSVVDIAANPRVDRLPRRRHNIAALRPQSGRMSRMH
jgi:hypothetical protein